MLRDAKSINIFFSLLRSGMYGTAIPESELPDSIDWNVIVKLAQKHVVFGIIIDGVQHLPERLRPSAASLARMDKFALGLIHANIVFDKAAARLVEFLKQHDINGVLLKGQGVARYYRVPQMRQNGDIDFYVGKTAHKKAVRLCRAELADDVKSCSESEQHFDFNMSDITVELHRIATKIYSPLRNRKFQKWITEELEHSPNRRKLTLDNTDVTLPSYEFDAIFIFYHAWRHYITGGIGLRQLCDWVMVFNTHVNDIDTEKLKDNIERFGIMKGWKLFASIAVRHLGLPEDKMPLYDPAYDKKSEKVLEEIVTGGNFGYYSEAYMRTNGRGYIGYSLGKVRNATEGFFSLFPLIPVEATFLYFSRLYYGTVYYTKRLMRK